MGCLHIGQVDGKMRFAQPTQMPPWQHSSSTAFRGPAEGPADVSGWLSAYRAGPQLPCLPMKGPSLRQCCHDCRGMLL